MEEMDIESEGGTPVSLGEKTALLRDANANANEKDWEFAGWGSVQRMTVPRNVESGAVQANGGVEHRYHSNGSNSADVHDPLAKSSRHSSRDLIADDHVQGQGQARSRCCSSFRMCPCMGSSSDESVSSKDGEKEKKVEHVQLDQWRATAISGNDITSSVLYVVGRCTFVAGKLAPISLVLVVMVLYLFRDIYTEVVTALPLNGGAYNALLNTTTKFVAAIAGGLTLLSYAATAVVSANSAASYAHTLYDGLPIGWITVAVLLAFALLTLMGITESANVAMAMFIFHMVTLVTLAVACMVYVFSHGNILQDNWKTQPQNGNYAADIYFGFCAALLGVSGFESSANFIEEQRPGVFSKTLRNMWAAVAIINPIMGLLALAVLPMPELLASQNNLLAQMGDAAAGDWLSMMVSIDGVIVLCGAVLTSYVGVLGLANRMTLDRCLPQFLLHRNKLRDSLHWIIVGFFLVTTSLYLIVDGNVTILDGVYAIAFLCVMALFTIGNALLKYKRNRLPREVKASWIAVIVAGSTVAAGAVGTIILDIDNLVYFLIYFAVTLFIIIVMLQRAFILKLLLYILATTGLYRWTGNFVRNSVHSIRQEAMIFFAKNDDVAVLNKAILYCRENELTNRLHIVHIYNDDSMHDRFGDTDFHLSYNEDTDDPSPDVLAGKFTFADSDDDLMLAESISRVTSAPQSTPGRRQRSGSSSSAMSAARFRSTRTLAPEAEQDVSSVGTIRVVSFSGAATDDDDDDDDEGDSRDGDGGPSHADRQAAAAFDEYRDPDRGSSLYDDEGKDDDDSEVDVVIVRGGRSRDADDPSALPPRAGAGARRAFADRSMRHIRQRENAAHSSSPEMRESLAHALKMLDRMYPKMRLDLILVEGAFTPQTIEYLSKQLSIPTNFMFISCPGDRFPYNLNEMGGIRLITH
jgi:amino acid transporter